MHNPITLVQKNDNYYLCFPHIQQEMPISKVMWFHIQEMYLAAGKQEQFAFDFFESCPFILDNANLSYCPRCRQERVIDWSGDYKEYIRCSTCRSLLWKVPSPWERKEKDLESTVEIDLSTTLDKSSTLTKQDVIE